MKKSLNSKTAFIILFASVPKTIVKRVIAVLKFPKNVNDFINYAKGIYKAMNGNTTFPASQTALGTLNTDIAQLATLQTNMKTKPPTSTKADRDAARIVVENDLRGLRNDVQKVADNNPVKAEVIIKSADMEVKKTAIKQKQVNAVKEGKVSGSVLLTAERAGGHEWEMSKDQITIINLPATSGAKTTVNGLTPGEVWYFRSRPILKKGQMGDWSAWIKIMIR